MQLISEENLTKIRELLPHGSSKLIAAKLRCTESTVSRTLNGKGNFPGVIDEALEIISGQKRLALKAEKIVRNGR